MSDEISMELCLFIEHGREREAAGFYSAALGAREIDTLEIDGSLLGIVMLFGNMPVSVAGANPRRESEPSRGGPFFPKVAGAVSTIFRINVPDIEVAMDRATSSGATIRDHVQTDPLGRRVASIFDPFGHIWALVERKRDAAALAA